MKRACFVLLIGIAFIACNPTTNSTQHSSAESQQVLKDSLSMALEQLLDMGQINGFSVAVVNDEKILYQKGFGFSDRVAQKKYTENTIQNIASISKTLIGIALLKAQEMGKLKLDDPISKYLAFDVKNPNFPDEAITIRHLATHTSSITDGDIYGEKSYIFKTLPDSAAAQSMEIPKEFNPPSDMTSLEPFLKNLLNEQGQWYSEKVFINNAPGTLFEYTNVGATLAAYIIELATGTKYSDFTSAHILKPLKMESSGWSFEDIDLTKHSKLYAKDHKELPLYSLITYPDGGLITSAYDLGTYLVELIRGYAGKGTLLTEASYQELYTMQLQAENFTERDEGIYNDEYNLGIFMGFSSKGYIGHTGGDPGVSSFMFFSAEDKIGRLLLINTDLVNEKGVQQFLGIWDELGKYHEKLKR